MNPNNDNDIAVDGDGDDNNNNQVKIKVKFTLEQATKSLDGVGGQSRFPVALPPEKTHGTQCKRGWVGLRVSLEGCRQSPPAYCTAVREE